MPFTNKRPLTLELEYKPDYFHMRVLIDPSRFTVGVRTLARTFGENAHNNPIREDIHTVEIRLSPAKTGNPYFQGVYTAVDIDTLPKELSRIYTYMKNEKCSDKANYDMDSITDPVTRENVFSLRFLVMSMYDQVPLFVSGGRDLDGQVRQGGDLYFHLPDYKTGDKYKTLNQLVGRVVSWGE